MPAILIFPAEIQPEKMLKELPKMTPGKRAGKSISIKYTIPVKL